MYVIREDAEFLRSKKVSELRKLYREKFGESFPYFNYADFPGSDTQIAAEMYYDALREALKRDEPTRIVSHRYDTIDH